MLVKRPDIGTRFINSDGYVDVYLPGHPMASTNGRVNEHRLMMSNALGRPLESYESVHHRNGDRSDNSIENLELWDRSQPSGQRATDKAQWAGTLLARIAPHHHELLDEELRLALVNQLTVVLRQLKDHP